MSHDLPTFQQNNILAIFFMLLTGACMVAVMVTLRYTDESLPSIQVAFIRYLFGLVIIFPFAISELKVRNLKIPIKSKQNLNGKPDCLIVLAWNFFDEIKKNGLNTKMLIDI